MKPDLPDAFRVALQCDSDSAALTEKSSGTFSGEFSGTIAMACEGRPIDLHRLRVVFPERWAGFLRAHFTGPAHVGFFFCVNERTARMWWEGVSAPRVEVVLALIERCPEALPLLLREAA